MQLRDQLGGVELDLVDGLVVDPAPQLLELALLEVRLVERDLLRLAAVGRRRQVEVERVDERPDEVDDRLEHLGRRRGERAVGAGVLVRLGDEAVVVDVVVLDEVVVQRLRDRLLDHARRPVGGRELLAGEEVDARLARAGRQRLDDLLLQPGDEVGVGLVGDDGQLVDVVHGDGVVHPLAVLVDRQAQAAADLLPARRWCCRSS